MAIYKMSDFAQKAQAPKKELNPVQEPPKESCSLKDRFFSSAGARLFFLFLLFVDLVWGAFSLGMIGLYLILNLATGFKSTLFKSKLGRCFLSLKRALVCLIALVVAVFSPALGIMFACSYFLMYDKKGIQEVVPASLQDQFKEFYTT
jgi:hypothetical protein